MHMAQTSYVFFFFKNIAISGACWRTGPSNTPQDKKIVQLKILLRVAVGFILSTFYATAQVLRDSRQRTRALHPILYTKKTWLRRRFFIDVIKEQCAHTYMDSKDLENIEKTYSREFCIRIRCRCNRSFLSNKTRIDFKSIIIIYNSWKVQLIRCSIGENAYNEIITHWTLGIFIITIFCLPNSNKNISK